MPKMIAVDSTSIAAVGYDEDRRELFVRFLSDGTYVYHDVDAPVFEALLAAESKGTHFNREVRPHYRYTKLS